MRKSLFEYIRALGRWGWVVLGDVIAGIAGAFLDISGIWRFPTWIWLILLIIGFIIVPFLAFHKLKLERDELRAKLQRDADNVEIEIGRISPHGTSVSLEFTLQVNNVPMQLARIELVMDDDSIPCSRMPTRRILDNIETHNVEFPIDMNKAFKHAKYESNQVSWSGTLCILAGGQKWESVEFVISSAPIRSISHKEDSQTE